MCILENEFICTGLKCEGCANQWAVCDRWDMDCKEFERLIPDYIMDKLNYESLNRFSEHMEHCEECREELVIQFLVTEGIQRLEDGNVFDLQGELNERLEETRKRVMRNRLFLRVGLGLEVAAVGLLAAGILWILL